MPRVRTVSGSGAAVSAIAVLYARGGFDLVLWSTVGVALGFLVACLLIALLVNSVERVHATVPADGRWDLVSWSLAAMPSVRKGVGKPQPIGLAARPLEGYGHLSSAAPRLYTLGRSVGVRW